MPPKKGDLRAKIAFAATGVLLSVGLLSPIQAFAIDDVNTQKLRKAVTVSGILQHERALQRIANQNDGTRASGTPGYDASAAYVAKKLRKAGYKVELSEVSPTATNFESETFTYSGSGEIQGPVIPTNDIVIPESSTQQHLGLRGK